MSELQKRRTAKGLSQNRLAAAAGISPITVQRAEAGCRMSPETTQLVAEALGCRPEDLAPRQKRRG